MSAAPDGNRRPPISCHLFTDGAFAPDSTFPAVLDPGGTHNFVIRDNQWQQWAGLRPEHFTELGQIQPHGETVPLDGASVCRHGNRPGQRDEFSHAPPLGVEMESG